MVIFIQIIKKKKPKRFNSVMILFSHVFKRDPLYPGDYTLNKCIKNLSVPLPFARSIRANSLRLLNPHEHPHFRRSGTLYLDPSAVRLLIRENNHFACHVIDLFSSYKALFRCPRCRFPYNRDKTPTSFISDSRSFCLVE